MNKKLSRRIISFISLLMSFIFVLGFEAKAYELFEDNNLGFAEKLNPDNSSTYGELNIISPQVILEGEEIQMNYEVSNSGTTVPVKWSSSNPHVISCTEGGKIKGLAKGKATITVKARNGKSSDSITVYCAKKLKEPETVAIITPFFWTNYTPVFFNFEKFRLNFGQIIFAGVKVTVLGYYDSFFYIEYKDGDKLCRSFIWSNFLPNSVGEDEIFRQISFYEIVLKVGESSAQKLTTNYKGNVEWTVFDEEIVSFDKNTGKITAKKPGVAIITAKVGTTRKSCMVYSVSQWFEPETAVATKDVTVRKTPSVTGNKAGTVLKGTIMTADGDFENGMRWVHITSGDIKGFVQLSDFPGINYLMAEYHYYDQGFEVRFDSGYEKIRDYSSILNDIMMRIFGLKISQHIEDYTSLADECKIKTYGSVYTNNLYADCPKTQGHFSDVCIVDLKMHDRMLADNGKCTNTVTRCLWTGHYLYDNKPSQFLINKGSILFTIAGYTNYSTSSNKFVNKPNDDVRERALYEIVHETGHALGAIDGYCKEDIQNGHCSNENCYACNRLPVPDCIMVNNKNNPEMRTSVFCEECIEIINSHLSNHH